MSCNSPDLPTSKSYTFYRKKIQCRNIFLAVELVDIELFWLFSSIFALKIECVCVKMGLIWVIFIFINFILKLLKVSKKKLLCEFCKVVELTRQVSWHTIHKVFQKKSTVWRSTEVYLLDWLSQFILKGRQLSSK